MMGADLAVNVIRTDGGTQPRAEGLDLTLVVDYADSLEAGAEFPPVAVFDDGADLWLVDGFHRLEAHRRAGRSTIRAEVTQGTLRDAVLASCSANAAHGKRRTNTDKRRAVLRLLEDSEWAELSGREVARRCGVSHPMVAKLRSELAEGGKVSTDVASDLPELAALRVPFCGASPDFPEAGQFVAVVASAHAGFVNAMCADLKTGAVRYSKRGVRADRIGAWLSRVLDIHPGALGWFEMSPDDDPFAPLVDSWQREDFAASLKPGVEAASRHAV